MIEGDVATGPAIMNSVLLLALLTMAGAQPMVTGTVTYRERIALPPGAQAIVRIWDVTRRDDWLEVGRAVVATTGQPPITFAVPYNPGRVRADGDYVVEARILHEGRLLWIHPAACPVLTRGFPSHLTVVVRPFTTGVPSVALTSKPSRDCVYGR